MVLGQSRVLQVEGRLSHEVGLVGKGKQPVARVKGCPGERKALVLERHSGMTLSRWKLNLENWQKPRVEAAWSEELGKWWEPPLPCMVGGLQQALLCKPHQVNLDMRADESCPCQGTSPGVCRGDEKQAAARSSQARRTRQARLGGGGGGSRTPQPCTAPVLTSQCSRCSPPRDDSHTLPSGLLPAQPQAARIPGFTP